MTYKVLYPFSNKRLVHFMFHSVKCVNSGSLGLPANSRGDPVSAAGRAAVANVTAGAVSPHDHGAALLLPLERDGAPDGLASTRQSFPWLQHGFADGAHAGDKLRAALASIGTGMLALIKRSEAWRFIVSVNQSTRKIASICNQIVSLWVSR